jgi:hypothetical protein
VKISEDFDEDGKSEISRIICKMSRVVLFLYSYLG